MVVVIPQESRGVANIAEDKWRSEWLDSLQSADEADYGGPGGDSYLSDIVVQSSFESNDAGRSLTYWFGGLFGMHTNYV